MPLTPDPLLSLLQTLVVQAMPHLVFVKDIEGIFHFANPAMATFYGRRTPEELIGRKADKEFNSDDDKWMKKFRADDEWVIANKVHRIIPRERVLGFGAESQIKELHWLNTIKLPLEHEGKTLVVGISTFIDNLVEEERKHALERRNQLWEVVARQVRHRMGNRVATLELAMEDLSPDENEVHLELVEAVGAIKVLLSDLTALQKAGNLKKASCSLRDILRTSVVDHRRDAAVSITVNRKPIAEAQMPEWRINADERKLGECFQELLRNARRWAPKTDCKIDVQVDYPAQPYGFGIFGLSRMSQTVTVKITDNGLGVAPEAKEIIFFPDVTAHPEGTGLGLAMVKEVIEAHGGVVSEIGEIGHGACFQLTFPI